MSDKVAIILGTIVVVGILFFTSWRSMIAINNSRELDRQAEIEIAREKMDFESREREKDRQLEREKIEHEREMLRRKSQGEKP